MPKVLSFMDLILITVLKKLRHKSSSNSLKVIELVSAIHSTDNY